MTNDCQYRPDSEPRLYCWQNYEDGTRRRGHWDCAKRYHWVEENEDLAYDWMPMPTIRWLLIAESPPCPRNEDEPPYIYRVIDEDERRPILEAIVSAFKIAANDKLDLGNKTDKLNYMKLTNEAFVMDLSEYPLNRLDKTTREGRRIESEYGLYLRLLRLLYSYHRKVENIAIVGKAWHESVLVAVNKAGLGHLVRNSVIGIPFPDQFHFAECQDSLVEFFDDPAYEKHLPHASIEDNEPS